jgi:hypothetical protein
MKKIVVMVSLVLAQGCHQATQAVMIAAHAPPVVPCTPGTSRCNGSAREVCVADENSNDTRWWSADAPYPDGGLRVCRTSCEMNDAGQAVCLPGATDGGAP